MVAKADLILDVEDMLYGMAQVERPEEDTLGAALTDSATSMTVDRDSLWKRGDYGEFVPADGSVDEIVRATADGSAGSVSIRRAQRQTTAAAQADGDVLRKNPYYPRAVIDRFIDEVIRDELYPHVYYRTERTLTFTDQDYTYDLDADDFDVLSVYQYNVDSDNRIQRFPQAWWDVEPIVSTTVAATGKALRLRRVVDQTTDVYYTAKTIPKVANVAAFPDELASLIPWAVCGQILGGTRSAARRHDPNRQSEPEAFEGGVQRDWRFFEQKFLLKRDAYRRRLRFEERHLAQQRYVPTRRGARLGRVYG